MPRREPGQSYPRVKPGRGLYVQREQQRITGVRRARRNQDRESRSKRQTKTRKDGHHNVQNEPESIPKWYVIRAPETPPNRCGQQNPPPPGPPATTRGHRQRGHCGKGRHQLGPWLATCQTKTTLEHPQIGKGQIIIQGRNESGPDSLGKNKQGTDVAKKQMNV